MRIQQGLVGEAHLAEPHCADTDHAAAPTAARDRSVNSPARWSARRRAKAIKVKVEFAWLEVGKVELLATKRSSKPWTARFPSTTPSSARADIRVVPAW